ncbi:MAG TPA: OmpA family protein, partial [Actinomycetes bacterium]|nr:OmpA family protein [Actinomycetes bacterium]
RKTVTKYGRGQPRPTTVTPPPVVTARMRRRRAALAVAAAIVSVGLASYTGYLAIARSSNNAAKVSTQLTATVTSRPTTSPSRALSEQPLGPSATPVPGGGTRLRLSGTVLFGRDSAVLRPEARRIIQDLAKGLRAAAGGSVTVVGYTDNIGTAQHGLILSRHRARAVADLLTLYLGDTSIRISAYGRGEQDPVAPNDTEQHRAQNRRVEITYQPA